MALAAPYLSRTTNFFQQLPLLILFIIISGYCWKASRADDDRRLAPALFVFGDSLVDVGNNNYLRLSIARADFPHNGIDFTTHKPTGRFSNGKNAADFLAEMLGLPSPPPYLSLLRRKTNISSSLTGINFASGGAGILNGSDQFYRQAIPMSRQSQYFSAVQAILVKQLGQSSAGDELSKAIFGIVIGSNDILGYFGSKSNASKKVTPQQLVDSMVDTIKGQLKGIYDLGGRKFVMIGIGAIGCCPSQRSKNKSGECDEETNYWVSQYNKGLKSVLEEFGSQLQGFHYTYFDTYDVLLNFIQNPVSYGFKEVKAACCGLGYLNARVACLPISSYCHNRSDHVFWDLYHPTEAAARMVVETAFDGPNKYAFPVNVRQLVAL